MAHKKAGGKTSQHVRPTGKRLGLKISQGQEVYPGMILVRQRGTAVKAGEGVKVGRDHTLFAASNGVTKFSQKYGKKYLSVVSK